MIRINSAWRVRRLRKEEASQFGLEVCWLDEIFIIRVGRAFSLAKQEAKPKERAFD